jgi:hypothetical protein
VHESLHFYRFNAATEPTVVFRASYGLDLSLPGFQVFLNGEFKLGSEASSESDRHAEYADSGRVVPNAKSTAYAYSEKFVISRSPAQARPVAPQNQKLLAAVAL